MEIRTKILEKSGYDEVFTVDDDYGSSFEYNSIKDLFSLRCINDCDYYGHSLRL